MASFNHDLPLEGGSFNRPPFFNGTDYPYWKSRMQIFLEAQDYRIWRMVEKGYSQPMELNAEKVLIPKEIDKYNEDEYKELTWNSKAKSHITNALGRDEYYRVSTCKTAKEMWKVLEITHEGTNEVKRSKQNALTREYELFEMEDDESVYDLQKRFTHLTTKLSALGVNYTEEQQVNKILRCMTKDWDSKISAIYEGKDLSNLSIPILFGKLQEHEMEIKRHALRDQTKKKGKNIALKVTEPKEESSEDEEENLGVKEIAFFMKNLGKMVNKSFGRKKFQAAAQRKNKGDSNSSKAQITCYECGKEGHYKYECPTLEKKSKDERRSSKARNKGREPTLHGMKIHQVFHPLLVMKKPTFASWPRKKTNAR